MDAGNTLVSVGAHWPHSPAPTPRNDLAELAHLASLATPEAHALLAALEHAQEGAERVDEQRGHCLPPDFPLQPGESRGTDLAESISQRALRVRWEVYGPRGQTH